MGIHIPMWKQNDDGRRRSRSSCPTDPRREDQALQDLVPFLEYLLVIRGLTGQLDIREILPSIVDVEARLRIEDPTETQKYKHGQYSYCHGLAKDVFEEMVHFGRGRKSTNIGMMPTDENGTLVTNATAYTDCWSKWTNYKIELYNFTRSPNLHVRITENGA